mgnify:CR=1 FL=1
MSERDRARETQREAIADAEQAADQLAEALQAMRGSLQARAEGSPRAAELAEEAVSWLSRAGAQVRSAAERASMAHDGFAGNADDDRIAELTSPQHGEFPPPEDFPE